MSETGASPCHERDGFRAARIRPGFVLEIQDSGPTEVPAHVHDGLLVSVLLSPSVRVERRDGARRWTGVFRWGDAGVYPPGVEREVRWHDDVRFAHLHIDPRFLEPEARKSAPAAEPVRERTRTRDPLLRELVRSTMLHVESTPSREDLVFDALLEAVTAHLVRPHGAIREDGWAGSGPGDERSGLAPEDLRLLDDFIHAHLTETLTVDDLAQVVGLPRRLFSRLFREHTGRSPYQHVVSVRLEAAADLIRHGRDSLSTVAIRTGFYDQSHLTRHFTRRFGVTPGYFRDWG